MFIVKLEKIKNLNEAIPVIEEGGIEFGAISESVIFKGEEIGMEELDPNGDYLATFNYTNFAIITSDFIIEEEGYIPYCVVRMNDDGSFDIVMKFEK